MPARPPALLLAALAIIGTASAASAAEHVLCRDVRQAKPSAATPVFAPYSRLAVRDRVMPGGRLVDVRKPTAACVPAGVDGPVSGSATGFLGHDVRPTRTTPVQPRLEPRDVDVAAPWGTRRSA